MTGSPDGSPARSPSLAAALLSELTTLEGRIASADPGAVGPLWGAMHKALLKAKVPPAEIMPLVAGRDVAGLSSLLARVRGETVAAPAELASAPKSTPIDPDVLRHAMRAFRQRLKVMRLDAESRLGVGPMSGGRQHGIDAINPPREFPLAVWEALADEGKLRRAGPGFYALAEESE